MLIIISGFRVENFLPLFRRPTVMHPYYTLIPMSYLKTFVSYSDQIY